MEKVCLELKDIEMTFLDKLVLSIPRLAVYQFDRIGIVGKNGAGKSTLLKLMAGEIKPEKGIMKSFVDFAYFDQVSTPEDGVVEAELISKLSIPTTKLEHFSGGEQTKLKLAQIFSSYYEGMLIDEPTTHVDERGTQFFIEQMTYYYGALVLVSHDRYVLDQLVTKIWEIENGEITEYVGNYSEYIAQKELKRKQQEENHDRYIKEKTRLLKAADEKMKKAKKITEANSRISKKETSALANKMFMTKSKGTSQKAVQRAAKAIEQRAEQLEVVEAPRSEEVVRFHQAPILKLHNKFPIMADRLTLKAGNKVLLQEASFQFPLGNIVAIRGENGSGKSTLLQHIYNRGKGLAVSPKAAFGFYKQMSYQFERDEEVFAYLQARSNYDARKIRSVLHSMNFNGNDLNKNVHNLSGGEAVRLVLCELFLGKYNILLLDEPTNFLDVFCIEALEKFMNGYEGTILLVSHDRFFVERVADLEYSMVDKKLKLIK